MTIRWTNSDFQKEVASDNLVFQNALYALKFSPMDNDLVINLEVESTEIIRNQTAILNGRGSYITNLPASLRQQGLRWTWTCPDLISSLCENQTSSILSIPWSKVVDADVTFEYAYTIEMIVTWSKLDGTIEAKKRTAVITWYDMEVPDFEITYTPVPVLVTDTKNTAFSIVSKNFDVKKEYRSYTI